MHGCAEEFGDAVVRLAIRLAEPFLIHCKAWQARLLDLTQKVCGDVYRVMVGEVDHVAMMVV